MTDAVGATVAMIASPLQALNLLEYAHVAGTGVDLVLVGDAMTPERTLPQVERVLALLPGATVHYRRAGGWGLSDGEFWEPMRAEAAELAASLGRPVGRLVVGDHRATFPFQWARLLGLRPQDVVVIDDGMATLLVDRLPGSAWEQSLAGDRSDLPVDDRIPRGVTFFTSYHEDLRAAAEDAVVPNSYAFLRQRYAELDVDPDLVVAIGSALTEPPENLAPADDLGLALRLVETTRSRFPRARVLYAPHRRERRDNLDVVARFAEVIDLGVPFELAPLVLGALPGAVVGFYSSLLSNFATLVAGIPGPVVVAHRAPVELFGPGAREKIPSYYAFLAGHASGKIEVTDLAPTAVTNAR